MTQISDKPAPLPAPRPVILAEGSVLAVQRLRKAKAAYLAGAAQSREENERLHAQYLDAAADLGDFVLLEVYAASTRTTQSRTDTEKGTPSPYRPWLQSALITRSLNNDCLYLPCL